MSLRIMAPVILPEKKYIHDTLHDIFLRGLTSEYDPGNDPETRTVDRESDEHPSVPRNGIQGRPWG